MTERYQFHFRHILKDGTVLKEGEKLPVTPASQATFAEVARILIEARKKKQDKVLLLDPVVLGEGGIRQ